MSARGLAARRGAFVLDVPAFDADARGTVLLGANGAGKTTLLLALHGLIPARGSVRRPPRTASVFARPAVLRGPVLWNVAVVVAHVVHAARADAQERARRVLRAVGLEDVASADARTLSTGQRQRLALARALAIEPAALLLDEPFANVDADARPSLRALVRSYVETSRCALALATSSLADAAALCEDAVVLRGGRIVDASATRLLGASRDPYVRALVAESRVLA